MAAGKEEALELYIAGIRRAAVLTDRAHDRLDSDLRRYLAIRSQQPGPVDLATAQQIIYSGQDSSQFVEIATPFALADCLGQAAIRTAGYRSPSMLVVSYKDTRPDNAELWKIPLGRLPLIMAIGYRAGRVDFYGNQIYSPETMRLYSDVVNVLRRDRGDRGNQDEEVFQDANQTLGVGEAGGRRYDLIYFEGSPFPFPADRVKVVRDLFYHHLHPEGVMIIPPTIDFGDYYDAAYDLIRARLAGYGTQYKHTGVYDRPNGTVHCQYNTEDGAPRPALKLVYRLLSSSTA